MKLFHPFYCIRTYIWIVLCHNAQNTLLCNVVCFYNAVSSTQDTFWGYVDVDYYICCCLQPTNIFHFCITIICLILVCFRRIVLETSRDCCWLCWVKLNSWNVADGRSRNSSYRINRTHVHVSVGAYCNIYIDLILCAMCTIMLKDFKVKHVLLYLNRSRVCRVHCLIIWCL